MKRQKKYFAKIEQRDAYYRSWQGDKGFREKGLPLMGITATSVVTGALTIGGAGLTAVDYFIAGASISNNAHTLNGSPLNKYSWMPYVSLLIDVVSFGRGFKPITEAPGKIPSIATDAASVGVGINSIIKK